MCRFPRIVDEAVPHRGAAGDGQPPVAVISAVLPDAAVTRLDRPRLFDLQHFEQTVQGGPDEAHCGQRNEASGGGHQGLPGLPGLGSDVPVRGPPSPRRHVTLDIEQRVVR